MGLAPEPDIRAVIVDVPLSNRDFYQKLIEVAESLKSRGLIYGFRSESPYADPTRHWIGPAEAAQEFSEAARALISELDSQEAPQACRCWVLDNSQRAMEEWTSRWAEYHDL
jgi:hypothetical protein